MEITEKIILTTDEGKTIELSETEAYGLFQKLKLKFEGDREVVPVYPYPNELPFPWSPWVITYTGTDEKLRHEAEDIKELENA